MRGSEGHKHSSSSDAQIIKQGENMLSRGDDLLAKDTDTFPPISARLTPYVQGQGVPPITLISKQLKETHLFSILVPSIISFCDITIYPSLRFTTSEQTLLLVFLQLFPGQQKPCCSHFLALPSSASSLSPLCLWPTPGLSAYPLMCAIDSQLTFPPLTPPPATPDATLQPGGRSEIWTKPYHFPV